MERRQLKYIDGRYEVEIDITVEEWKTMLQNPEIFKPEYLDMVLKWYYEIDHRATNHAIMAKYPSDLKGTPYNGYVKGLTNGILKHLNRFEVIGTTGKKSYFSVPFEGWYEDYKEGNHFVWKVRDELVQAIEELGEELGIVDEKKFPSEEEELTSYDGEERDEGKKRRRYTTLYERNPKNRRDAVKIHGTVCQACGFDFEKTYGEIGKDYIEVHHIKPLYEGEGPVKVNAATDLICVCPNCHRMIHRRKDKVLSLKELQLLLSSKKNRVNEKAV
jgi:5-methylcytosine-specific restriction protein A